MLRSIPPRTMLDLWREEKGIKRETAVKPSVYKPKVYKKPREWIYETKPIFKKIREPLVDVFKEAEDVRIIIDLGSFSRGEVDIDIKPDRYIITARHAEQEFSEEILLPEDVDTGKTEEHFKNGILELVLPRKKLKGK